MDIMTSHLSKLSYTEISMTDIRLGEKIRKAVFPVASIVAPRVAR